MKVKNIFGYLFLLLFFCSAGICYGSPATYQITGIELNKLEQNLQEQETLLTQLQSELALLKIDSTEAHSQLLIALEELNQSKIELKALKTDLIKSKTSLEKANQLFKEYEKEAKQTKSRLIRQRNLYVILGLLVGGYGISR